MVQIFLLMLRLLEKSFELKTQDYEKQIRSLREEIKALKDEKMQLQRELEEERVTSDGLKGEVARLSKQAKVGLLASWLICLTCTRESGFTSPQCQLKASKLVSPSTLQCKPF